MTGAPAWRTVCAYHHDEQGMDPLVLDAVRPLFGQLAANTDAAYFLRHWRRGPHLRLNVKATAEVWRRLVLPAVRTVVGGYLHRHPSSSTMDSGAVLADHRRLAEAEREPGPVWPWRPDNSVHTEPYDSRAHVLGGDDAAAFVAAFYGTANEAAFVATESVRGGAGRLWTALDLMIATVHAFAAGGVRGGYVSFRAHAEVFLAGDPARERMRAEWDRRYRDAGPALRARLRSVVADTPSPAVGAWLAAIGEISGPAFAIVDSGQLRMDSAPAGRPAPAGASPFLRELITNDDFHQRLMPSAAFGRYRLLLNLLYLQLTRLGLRPVERYLLCHLIANSVEEVYGVDAVTVLRANSAAAGGDS